LWNSNVNRWLLLPRQHISRGVIGRLVVFVYLLWRGYNCDATRLRFDRRATSMRRMRVFAGLANDSSKWLAPATWPVTWQRLVIMIMTHGQAYHRTSSTKQWRKGLHACEIAKGYHLEHLLDSNVFFRGTTVHTTQPVLFRATIYQENMLTLLVISVVAI